MEAKSNRISDSSYFSVSVVTVIVLIALYVASIRWDTTANAKDIAAIQAVQAVSETRWQEIQNRLIRIEDAVGADKPENTGRTPATGP